MKKILFSFIAFVFLTSCKENKELYFDTNAQSLNIWFGSTNVIEDSVSYNFAYALKNRDSVLFNARLLGYPNSKDIEFELEAIDGDKDLVYYSTPKYTLKAGQTDLRLPIYIDKPENYQEFKNKTGFITFRLKETSTLKTGTKEMSTLKISFKNNISKPTNWDNESDYRYKSMDSYFGTYSDRKYLFIMEVTGMTHFRIFVTGTKDLEASDNQITTSTANYYASLIKLALLEYEAKNGPMMDENGNRVTF